MIEEVLFHRALEKPTLAEQLAFLAEACPDQPELRERVERLLRSHRHEDSFLWPGVTTDEPVAERPGTVIGPYKLLEQIGEGGMGTVWMAQQTEPVKRLVALKLIKAGMDSRQVIARFEAERQALALMDHTNIARVLDGGTTSAGRPYFVMDLVKGVPITKYCDDQHLTPRQRLELFVPICRAVQHAHQKGIIHRDLKPSNVLVALYDGKPVPKVIDFGVAKAAGQSLTDKTLVTGFGAIVGTLEYMSPEQAEVNQLDIDTRSDIYSLGVLLYELLTGSPPFVRKDLAKAGMLEMLRVIREQEPSKPSTKLSTAEGLPTLAANRGTEPAKLTRLVRGELDWIVMKALEKDRNRRYQSPNSLVDDVQHYLQDKPVQACPPSVGYRLRKFVRRNKAAVAMIAVVAVALVAVAAVGGLAYRNEQQRVAERKSHEEHLLAEKRQFALEKALLAVMSGNLDGAEKVVNEAELLGASNGQVRMLRGQVAFHRGDMEAAIQHLEQAANLVPAGQPSAVAVRAMLALACMHDATHLPRFVELTRELDQLAPITAEDFLFKGLLETTIQPERGLRTLDEGIRQHNSVLARATRLEARANRALVTGDVGLAEQALKDAEVAREMLPGNALVLARSVFAHLVAAGTYESKDRAKDGERVLAQARPLVQELERFAAMPFAAQACFEYFEYVGDEEAAFAISGQGNQMRRAVMLYRRGEFPKALEAAAERSRNRAAGPTQRIERAIIMAELADGPARARIVFDELQADGGWQVTPPMILMFLGRPADARQAFLQVRKEALPWDDGWFGKILDFGCGRITADGLLQAAGEARSRMSDTYFLVGLGRLSEGDRIAARDHFQRCVATRVFNSWEWPWVRAFLVRMEQDPAWPRWIPVKK